MPDSAKSPLNKQAKIDLNPLRLKEFLGDNENHFQGSPLDELSLTKAELLNKWVKKAKENQAFLTVLEGREAQVIDQFIDNATWEGVAVEEQPAVKKALKELLQDSDFNCQAVSAPTHQDLLATAMHQADPNLSLKEAHTKAGRGIETIKTTIANQSDFALVKEFDTIKADYPAQLKQQVAARKKAVIDHLGLMGVSDELMARYNIDTLIQNSTRLLDLGVEYWDKEEQKILATILKDHYYTTPEGIQAVEAKAQAIWNEAQTAVKQKMATAKQKHFAEQAPKVKPNSGNGLTSAVDSATSGKAGFFDELFHNSKVRNAGLIAAGVTLLVGGGLTAYSALSDQNNDDKQAKNKPSQLPKEN